VVFELFDPRGELCVREGRLPHWYQAGVTYFVTFRTDDSVPRELSQGWYARRDAWLRREGIDPSRPDWKTTLKSRPEMEHAFHVTFTREFMEYLDRGYGACALRRPDLAKIVRDSLTHFDKDRYRLGDFVVMPNHVHLLVCLVGGTEIERLCKSWKRFAAVEINRALGQTGRFWQSESFDHLVRSPEQFAALQVYIAENPNKANLQKGEYLHHVCAL
jgi:putative transposase